MIVVKQQKKLLKYRYIIVLTQKNKLLKYRYMIVVTQQKKLLNSGINSCLGIQNATEQILPKI